MLEVELVQPLEEALALASPVQGHLGGHGGGGDAVLVAHLVLDEVAVALLGAVDEVQAIPLEAAHEVGYPLEAGQALVALGAVRGGDPCLQLGGHDALDRGRSPGHEAELLPGQEDVVSMEGAELVAGDEDEAAVPSGTAMPSRSASGSVAITTSALTFAPSSRAILRAAASSGLGKATVGKSPSGSRCSGTVTTDKPRSPMTRSKCRAPVPCRGV